MHTCILDEKNFCQNRHPGMEHPGHLAKYATEHTEKAERFRVQWDRQHKTGLLAQYIQSGNSAKKCGGCDQPAPEVKSLSFLTKVRHYIGSLANHITGGMREVPAEVRAFRRQTCEECEHRNLADDTCNLCGCPLHATILGDKLSMATESCPVHRWGTWPPDVIETPVGKMGAYILAIPGRVDELEQTLTRWEQSDWPGSPIVVMQSPTVPVASQDDRWKATADNSYALIKRMYDDGCDYGLFTEDDIEPNKHLFHNLVNWLPLYAGVLEIASLYMPGMIDRAYHPTVNHRPMPEEGVILARTFPDLNYRIPRPLGGRFPRGNYWGSQCYVMSRQFMKWCLEDWYSVKGGQDSRVIRIARNHGVDIIYHWPDLVEHHHPATGSNFRSPDHKSLDFDPDWKSEARPMDFQYPKDKPGYLTPAEAMTLTRWVRGKRGRIIGGNPKVAEIIERAKCQQDENRDYDFILISQTGTRQQTSQAIDMALPLLKKENALLLVHYYGMHDNQGVTASADEYATARLWRLVDRAESLAVFKVS